MRDCCLLRLCREASSAIHAARGVPHERKSRMALAARLAGKTAAETISVMLEVFARIEPALRKWKAIRIKAGLRPPRGFLRMRQHDESFI
jgi:hypothetical protein